jgi:hypothetical protein
MMNSPIPQNFDEWRHCITVECGIPLTPEYVQERLATWRDGSCEETRRFRKRYGDAYLQQVIGWFEQAERELA